MNSINICNLFHHLTLTEPEKQKLLPSIPGEKNYLVRFMITFHPDFVYMTSFLSYHFLQLYSDKYDMYHYEIFFYIREYLSKELSVLLVILKYEKEFPDSSYKEFLRCSFDKFLDEIKEVLVGGNEYIEDIIYDYINANRDKILNPIEFIRESNNESLFAQVFASIAVEDDNMEMFTEILKDADIDVYIYYPITKTVSKTQRIDYLLYLLKYSDLYDYFDDMRFEVDSKILITAFAAAKIAFRLNDKELVDLVSNYISGNAFDALRDLGVPLELIKAKDTEYIRKWLTTNV